MVYKIKEIYKLNKDKEFKYDTNIQSFVDAANILKQSINNHNLALIQGPPGTGKTSLYEFLLQDQKIWDLLEQDNEVVVYIAPTNKLVADMLTKVSKYFPNENDFKESVRVYGSQFDYSEFSQLRKELNDKVKLVLTTDYQKIFITLSESLRRFHLLIDEASKSPLHREFTPIVDALLTKGKKVLGSLNIVGDPMQAISLIEPYRINKAEYLLMQKVLSKLYCMQYSDKCSDSKNDNFPQVMDYIYQEIAQGRNPLHSNYVFLDITKRLPNPAHKIISEAYYGGNLKSMKELKIGDYEENMLQKFKNDYDDTIKAIANNAEEALSTNRIGIYHEIKEQSYKDPEGDLYDKNRATIAAYYAVLLSSVTDKHTTITAPYVEMSIQIEMKVKELISKYNLNSLKDQINVSTVQSMIGGEDENVIAVLGKEYVVHSEELWPTIYFMEPELLNVQLSRQKSLLVIIGDLGLLRSSVNRHSKENSKLKSLKKVIENVAELAGIELGGEIKTRIKVTDRSKYLVYYRKR
ncbi:MAG: DEAD/DEAH box helicase [Thermoproteota archaeon]